MKERSKLKDVAYSINSRFAGWGRFDAGVLKIIAVITMLIDHVTYGFLEVARPGENPLLYNINGGADLDLLGRFIGRTAFPIFCFLVVEGYVHTRSRAKYLFRLLLFAVISQAPFVLLFFPFSQRLHMDTLFTLSMGLISVWAIDVLVTEYAGISPRSTVRGEGSQTGEETKKVRAYSRLSLLWRIPLAAAVTGALAYCAKKCGTDYGYGGVLLIVIMYLLYNVRALSLAAGYVCISYYNSNEIFSLPGIILAMMYNGRKGKQLKYFFYIFYPAHLFIIYLVRRAVLGF